MKDFPQPEINKASADLIAEFNRERFHQDTESERQLGQVRERVRERICLICITSKKEF